MNTEYMILKQRVEAVRSLSSVMSAEKQKYYLTEILLCTSISDFTFLDRDNIEYIQSCDIDFTYNRTGDVGQKI